MFGHLQRAMTSGSRKLLPLNERLSGIRSDTSFASAHYVTCITSQHNRSRFSPQVSNKEAERGI